MFEVRTMLDNLGFVTPTRGKTSDLGALTCRMAWGSSYLLSVSTCKVQTSAQLEDSKEPSHSETQPAGMTFVWGPFSPQRSRVRIKMVIIINRNI